MSNRTVEFQSLQSSSQYPRSKGSTSRVSVGRYRDDRSRASFASFSDIRSAGSISSTPADGDGGRISKLLLICSTCELFVDKDGPVSLELRTRSPCCKYPILDLFAGGGSDPARGDRAGERLLTAVLAICVTSGHKCSKATTSVSAVATGVSGLSPSCWVVGMKLTRSIKPGVWVRSDSL